jgi:hypothetical protein
MATIHATPSHTHAQTILRGVQCRRSKARTINRASEFSPPIIALIALRSMSATVLATSDLVEPGRPFLLVPPGSSGMLPALPNPDMFAGMKRRKPTSPSLSVAGGTRPDAFPVQRVSRTGKTYYLVQRISKTGRPAYTFTTTPQGQPVDAIPDGYEIYESVEAQVFLRKKVTLLVSDAEMALIADALRTQDPAWRHWVEAKKDTVTIHEAGGDMESLSEMCRMFRGRGLTDDERRRHAGYMAVLRFTLVDPETREYVTERYCFRGSVDDWIHIGGPGPLAPQCRKFVPHLGRESFYDLF